MTILNKLRTGKAMNMPLEGEAREKVIVATIEVVSEKGVWGSTLREIGKRAGLEDREIFQYYSSEKEIFHDYYEYIQLRVIEELELIDDLESFTLQEKLQIFIETQLDYFGENREFVQKTFFRVFLSPKNLLRGLPGHKIANSALREFLEKESPENGSPLGVLQQNNLAPELLGSYFFFISAYWIRDKSPHFSNTSQVIDLSLLIMVDTLQSKMPEKIFNLMTLLFRLHIFNRLEDIVRTFQSFSGKQQDPGITDLNYQDFE